VSAVLSLASEGVSPASSVAGNPCHVSSKQLWSVTDVRGSISSNASDAGGNSGMMSRAEGDASTLGSPAISTMVPGLPAEISREMGMNNPDTPFFSDKEPAGGNRNEPVTAANSFSSYYSQYANYASNFCSSDEFSVLERDLMLAEIQQHEFHQTTLLSDILAKTVEGGACAPTKDERDDDVAIVLSERAGSARSGSKSGRKSPTATPTASTPKSSNSPTATNNSSRFGHTGKTGLPRSSPWQTVLEILNLNFGGALATEARRLQENDLYVGIDESDLYEKRNLPGSAAAAGIVNLHR
jgi:hypothetical protein